MQEFIFSLQSVSPIIVYIAVFTFAYVENVFPPSPSDTVIVLAGSLVGLQRVGFLETLVIATLGSALGFMTMYKVGEWFGEKIIETGKLKFLPRRAIKKVEMWFAKYGYTIIVANRFLSGTRAAVSFFAGMSELRLLETTVLCFLSALAWNGILVAGGYYLGQNWQQIEFYLSRYSEVVTGIIILAVIIWFVRYQVNKKKQTVDAP